VQHWNTIQRNSDFVDKEKTMQMNRKNNMGKHMAALLFTGFYMLAAAHVTLAQTPKVQIDMAKINQALNQQAKSGNGTTASSTMPNMSNMPGTSSSMGSTGNMQQPTMPAQQVLDASMQDAIISSDIMAEVQQKVMAENMKSIQKSMMESIMKNMVGSVQGAMQGSTQGSAQGATQGATQGSAQGSVVK
jgi:hypothetical protein